MHRVTSCPGSRVTRLSSGKICRGLLSVGCHNNTIFSYPPLPFHTCCYSQAITSCPSELGTWGRCWAGHCAWGGNFQSSEGLILSASGISRTARQTHTRVRLHRSCSVEPLCCTCVWKKIICHHRKILHFATVHLCFGFSNRGSLWCNNENMHFDLLHSYSQEFR